MGVKEQLQELEDDIARGLTIAYRKMVEFKKRKNSPLIISRDGEVVEVDAKDIVLPTDKE